eukprot:SAG31_NODE_957_length_10768_cov_3.322992_2_plen_50_part_00
MPSTYYLDSCLHSEHARAGQLQVSGGHVTRTKFNLNLVPVVLASQYQSD